jgi:YegS/Rv2252/BmrU family lipid kinase
LTAHSEEDIRRVLVLVNPRSGLPRPFGFIREAMDTFWDRPGVDLSYQFSQSTEDGVIKVRRAVDRGVHTVLVVGGDGTVSTIGRVLVGSPVCLGVVPTGSGNGFARHFGLPLRAASAIRALVDAEVREIDVGMVNDRPFLVTSSMAWDASLVKTFDKLPIRGVLPYVFAGFQEFFQYRPQRMEVDIDGREHVVFTDPLVFTVANLSEYGGGARIAPRARADDGQLELVVARQRDVPMLINNFARFFDGSIQQIPQIFLRTFRSLRIRRKEPAPIQVDGELVDALSEIHVRVIPRALRVLVPHPAKGAKP